MTTIVIITIIIIITITVIIISISIIIITITIAVIMITRYAPEGKPMYQIVEELAEDNEYFAEVHLFTAIPKFFTVLFL